MMFCVWFLHCKRRIYDIPDTVVKLIDIPNKLQLAVRFRGCCCVRRTTDTQPWRQLSIGTSIAVEKCVGRIERLGWQNHKNMDLDLRDPSAMRS